MRRRNKQLSRLCVHRIRISTTLQCATTCERALSVSRTTRSCKCREPIFKKRYACSTSFYISFFSTMHVVFFSASWLSVTRRCISHSEKVDQASNSTRTRCSHQLVQENTRCQPAVGRVCAVEPLCYREHRLRVARSRSARQ